MPAHNPEHAPHWVIVGNGMVGHRLCEELVSAGLVGGSGARLTVFGDEPRPAYDRVRLTQYLESGDASSLALADADWYAQRGIDLHLGDRVTTIDRAGSRVVSVAGRRQAFDRLFLCTGSAPWVPPIDGVDLPGVFVYRTIEDLAAIARRSTTSTRCAVIGGGLLGLEAARAVQECGLETHVVELAEHLMPRQLDGTGGGFLGREVAAMGIEVHTGRRSTAIVGGEAVAALAFDDGTELAVDMVVISAGIRPRDGLAREAGLAVAERGGIVVDDQLTTDDPRIHALGECASHRGVVHGLVAPGYEMARVLAERLAGDEDACFEGADGSAKLKLLGVDVASVGDPMAAATGAPTIAFSDFRSGVYKKLVLSECGTKLEGAILVGDASDYGTLLGYVRTGAALPEAPETLIVGERATAGAGSDDALICSCNNVTRGRLCQRIREAGLSTVSEVRSATRAGSGCGGCLPQVSDLLAAELAASGKACKPRLCEHFDLTRRELFDLVRVHGIRSFDELLKRFGAQSGTRGCEVCKPTAASIFASLDAAMILEDHATLQDTNDRFLANIQRRGLYSVVPRVPGGEITPLALVRLGQIADKYGLYTKITGGQRIDMFGAHLAQLPDIWEELVEAGFESGHAYAKGMRTIKSCVGSTWCRYGVQDSVGMAIRLERRYRGLRAPHKLKSAVSGCVRECAEAQSKDFGIIATDRGYNLYVGGNGGARPRHADLLASDLDDETLVRLIDRFLMYYIRTADKLTRTSTWLEKMDGGIEHVRAVVVDDSLGLGEELERQMQRLVDGYQCEWAAVVNDPEKRAAFRHFANSDDPDDTVFLIGQRGQHRPADWPVAPAPDTVRRLPILQTEWLEVGPVARIPVDGGLAVKHGRVQLAVFRYGPDRLFATQNMCPHKQDMVLARGILGDRDGEPKVACPMHKKTFSLLTGESLTGESYGLRTFPVKVEAGTVFVEVPPADELAQELCAGHLHCHADAAE